jgi:hypothetical protein
LLNPNYAQVANKPCHLDGVTYRAGDGNGTCKCGFDGAMSDQDGTVCG